MKYYVSLGVSSLEAQDRSRRTDRQFHRVREGRRVEDSQTRGGSKGRGHAVQDSSVVMPRYPVQAGTRQIAQCIKECVAVICKLTTLTSLLAELRLKLEACQLLVLPSTSFKVVGSKESPTFYLKQHKQPRCLTQTGFGFCIRITTGLRDQLISNARLRGGFRLLQMALHYILAARALLPYRFVCPTFRPSGEPERTLTSSQLPCLAQALTSICKAPHMRIHQPGRHATLTYGTVREAEVAKLKICSLAAGALHSCCPTTCFA